MGKQIIKETKHITAIFDSKALYEQFKGELPDQVLAFVKERPPDPVMVYSVSNLSSWYFKFGGNSRLLIQGGKKAKKWKLQNETVEFPISFSQVLAVVETYGKHGEPGGVGSGNNDNIGAVTNTSFRCYDDNNEYIYWIAIGVA